MGRSKAIGGEHFWNHASLINFSILVQLSCLNRSVADSYEAASLDPRQQLRTSQTSPQPPSILIQLEAGNEKTPRRSTRS
jgi:hypothetical protein